MSIQNLDKVPVGALKVGEVEISEGREIQAYRRSPFGAMGHVMNNAYRRFLEAGDNEKYRAKRLGMIPETEPFYCKPPEAKLLISFYDLSPKT